MKYTDFINENKSNMTRADAEEILGMGSSYTQAEIKKARTKAALKYHPDRGGSTAMTAKVNVAYDLLKNTTATGVAGGGFDWDAIHAKYQHLKVFVDNDLAAKYAPANFIKYFSDIFGEPFYHDFVIIGSAKDKNPSWAGFKSNFHNKDKTIAFDFDVSVYLVDVSKGEHVLSSGDPDISYPMGVTAFGYANRKKQKMAKRDWDSKNNYTILTQPEKTFLPAKMKKIKAAGGTTKMKKADFLLAMKNEVDSELYNRENNSYLIKLKDGWARVYRMVFMRQPMWVVTAVGDLKGKEIYSFDAKIVTHASFPEDQTTLDLFISFNKKTQAQVAKIIKKA